MEFYEIKDTNLIRQIVCWIVDIVVVLCLAWFVIFCFGTQIHIAGQSMLPILKSDDVVLLNSLIYKFVEPKRYDVIAFEREDQKSNVKRIIGLPGEEIQIKDSLIFINGIRLNRTDGLQQVSLAGMADNPVFLGDDEYFVLGDNREGSEDSRFANIGNIKKEQIMGKVWFRIFPFIDLGWID